MNVNTTVHEVQAVPLAVNDNADTNHIQISARQRQSDCTLQTRLQSQTLSSEYDEALGTISRIEAEAGPALANKLYKAKRFQAVYGHDRERKDTTKRRFGQRKGLLKLMRVEFHTDDPRDLTERARLYVRHMLMISANVAAFTGSRWSSTLSWFGKHLPALTAQLTPDALQVDFGRYVLESRTELAARIPSGNNALRTGPSPAEIAEDLSITTKQLRSAGANRCGLTSIDPEDRQTRDRNRKARERREKGMKVQGERTKLAEMKGLAERLGCSLSTIRRRDEAGTLAAFIAKHEADEQNVSPVLREFVEGQFLLTASDDSVPVETWPLTETGYAGRNITLSSRDVQHVLQRHPKFALDLPAHLQALDAQMSRAAPGCEKRVARNFLRDRHRAVSLAMTRAANSNESAAAA